MPELGGTAVVLGASMSGLLAARVLSDFYTEVIVVERDRLPDRPMARRGVPQGGLPHIPATRGTQILGELFPGFLDELVAGGARVWNDGDLSRLWISFGGRRLLRSGAISDPESMVTYFLRRPVLEWRVCQRVLALNNVQLLDGHDVVSLASINGCDRVTGVKVACRDGAVQTTLSAELVVDATGRGSRTHVFLDQLGYGRPREEKLTVRVAYAGLPVHLPPGVLRELISFSGPEASRPMGFAMFAGDNDTYMLAVQTVAGRQPPADRASLLACLGDLAPPHVLAAARVAEPLGDLVQYRFPSNRWRRYDEMARIPDGLIVMGDALCNFNPLYGHGISVAAIEALVLRDCLQQGGAGLPRRFFRACGEEIRTPWRAAVSSDLALPQIAGKRSMTTRMGNFYLDRLLAAAQTDAAVVRQFLRFIFLIDPPSRLLRPSTVLRVLKKSRLTFKSAA